MSSNEDYNLKLNEIKAIKDEDIKNPNAMPIDIFIQEAESLYHRAAKDKSELTQKGLDEKLIDDLPICCGALREAESKWVTLRYIKVDAKKEWSERNPAAYELRDELLRNFKFAYRKYPEIDRRVADIAEGSGHADMLQDLNDLAVLGNANPEQLKAINFDLALLKQASDLSRDLGRVLGKANIEEAGYSETKRIRDQAYTLLKSAVDEIREYGQFVFFKNEDILKGYKSSYMSKKSRQKVKKTDVKDGE